MAEAMSVLFEGGYLGGIDGVYGEVAAKGG
jgi:hypothetical protein